MLCTTLLLTLQIPFVKNVPWPIAIAFFLFFGFIDGQWWEESVPAVTQSLMIIPNQGAFFGATLRKVPHGAWFPLGIGCLL